MLHTVQYEYSTVLYEYPFLESRTWSGGASRCQTARTMVGCRTGTSTKPHELLACHQVPPGGTVEWQAVSGTLLVPLLSLMMLWARKHPAGPDLDDLVRVRIWRGGAHCS